MTKADLDEALRLHALWWIDTENGARANLIGANLIGADLRRADLRGADLGGAALWRANLWRANLGGAALRRANLWRANLKNADLRGAVLCGADLQNADLQEASMCGVNLLGADLRDANLRGANLWGVNLMHTRGVYALNVVDPRGYRPVAVEHEDGWRIASGCRWFTVPEALAHWGSPGYAHPEIAARYVRAINALPTPEGKEANARLIAAAPDMLKVLKKVRENVIGSRNTAAVDAAIAKAEGKNHD